jgi:hemolysin D
VKRFPENAFLPAALEVQATPPAPAGRAILWAILFLFTLAIVWATLSEVDIVTVAQGRIIPSGHSKTVQPLEIGTVSGIHVVEGQQVRAGDPLIELDARRARADLDRQEHELDAAVRGLARLRRLAFWLQNDGPPGPLPATGTADGLLIRQWQEFEDRLSVLGREQAQRLAEQRTAQLQIEKLNALLPIVTRRAKAEKGLAEQKLLSQQQYLETEQERLQVLYELRTEERRVAQFDAALAELDARTRYARSEFHRQTLEGVEAAERRRSIAETELAKALVRLRSRVISAPVDGVVQQLAVRNVGAIVTPAEELMVIVPQRSALEVEAILENKDIGFVGPGQPAEIKVDAFPFTRYGTVAGRIVDLSNDAVVDEARGLVYKMRVLMGQTVMRVNDRSVPLSPGMTVTVEAKTGTRRMIEYFLSPLLRYADESVRER